MLLCCSTACLLCHYCASNPGYSNLIIFLRQILGDQFVPTREVTVKICLPFSFQLTAEQQRTMTCSHLLKIEPESSKLPLSHHLQQPFVLPLFCSPGVETDIPSTCWARSVSRSALGDMPWVSELDSLCNKCST